MASAAIFSLMKVDSDGLIGELTLSKFLGKTLQAKETCGISFIDGNFKVASTIK